MAPQVDMVVHLVALDSLSLVWMKGLSTNGDLIGGRCTALFLTMRPPKTSSRPSQEYREAQPWPTLDESSHTCLMSSSGLSQPLSSASFLVGTPVRLAACSDREASVLAPLHHVRHNQHLVAPGEGRLAADRPVPHAVKLRETIDQTRRRSSIDIVAENPLPSSCSFHLVEFEVLDLKLFDAPPSASAKKTALLTPLPPVLRAIRILLDGALERVSPARSYDIIADVGADCLIRGVGVLRRTSRTAPGEGHLGRSGSSS